MAGDGFLHRYFLNNSHKRLHKWLHYFDIYERHFERFRGKNPTILEIGVAGGGSLAMWREYFGPGAQVVGLDVDARCKAHETENIEVFIGSQDDPVIIDQIVRKHPRIDIVLDDGSHRMTDMIATFRLLYQKVHEDGVYIVEDTHTCYWPDWGGGLKREGTFMEFVKDKLDEINAVHVNAVEGNQAVPVSAFTRSTNYIACYDSVVVFEKRRQGRRQAPRTAPM